MTTKPGTDTDNAVSLSTCNGAEVLGGAMYLIATDCVVVVVSAQSNCACFTISVPDSINPEPWPRSDSYRDHSYDSARFQTEASSPRNTSP
jgi:hypothetical protein